MEAKTNTATVNISLNLRKLFIKISVLLPIDFQMGSRSAGVRLKICVFEIVPLIEHAFVRTFSATAE